MDLDYDVHLIWKHTTDPWRIKEIMKKIKLHEVSLSDRESLTKLINSIKPNAIYHLAAHGAYPTQIDIDQMVDVAIKGTLNLLVASKNVDYDIFVNTGSSSEYGLKEKPMSETDLLEPLTFYAATKASSTYLSQVFAKQYNKPVVTFRLFSAYGPYEQPARFIPTIIKRALSNQSINITAEDISHDFIHIDDVVDAYILAIKHKDKLFGRIVNVGSGMQYTNFEVAKMILPIVGNNVDIVRESYPKRPWDSNYWVADTKLSEKLLGFKPKNNLKSGLSKTIDWIKKNSNLYL